MTETSPKELTWSSAEKRIARAAFERALERELDELIQKTKSMAAAIREPEQLWKLSSFLNLAGPRIDKKYDFRQSVLTTVFAQLLNEKRISLDDLQGLGEEKLRQIRSNAEFMAR